jgi:GNAT superfamily N-acetyltransferase
MQLDAYGPGRAYHTRRLVPPDLPALQRLFERAADYFEATTGAGPGTDEAERAFVGGPPSKSVNDKRTVGMFTRDDRLVGVLDAIPDFPADGTCTIGLLLLDPAVRGAGLGGATLAAFETWMAGHGATRFRTAIAATLDRGLAFLTRAGYRQASQLAGGTAGWPGPTVLILEKDLPQAAG